ncbi:MAG: sulfatase [Kiritimatiellales bacterium]|nr:sulfatase [Kiritimatiellales bacterium]
MKKLQIALMTGMIAAASLDATAMQRPAKPQPNIVMLFADDLGQADISYRRSRFDIPNMDQLAADGMTFTDAYAASPTCSPSRSAVLTGQHPARLRIVRHVPNNPTGEFNLLAGDPAQMPSRNWLPLEETTYAEALKPLGYKTAFVGKWHLGPESKFPVHQGFDEQYGVTESGHPKSYYPPYFPKTETAYSDVPKTKYLTDQLTDDAVAYIRKQDGTQPFNLTVFYYSVHGPHVGRKDLVEKLKDRGMEKSELHHAAMVEAVDESIGRIRAALAEKGLAENTIVIFAGDQGGQFDNTPMRGGKPAGVALFEGGARIPFIVQWPGVVKPGSSSSIPVVTTDIFPTMVQLAGGDPSSHPKLDGNSLTPLLAANGNLPRDDVFMYRSYESQYAAIRSGDWKLIAYRGGRMELFNLKNDLSEKSDLSAVEPGQLKKLTAKLIAWEKRTGVYEFGRSK